MTKCFLTIAMLAITGSSHIAQAQLPGWQWANNAIGTGSERGNSVSTDASGNAVVAGAFQSASITFGAVTLTCAGANDIFIAKYDAAGNVLWAKGAGGSGHDQAWGVSIDADGNVFVTGTFESAAITFDTITLTNAGSRNIFLAKYDASGNVLWAKSAGGIAVAQAYGVATDAGGNAFITGSFVSPAITFDTITLVHSPAVNYADIFIAKYDSSGNGLWAKSAAGTHGVSTVTNDQAYGVATDAAGNAMITGYFAGLTITFGTITLTNNTAIYGAYNIFLAKYDLNGNVLWAKTGSGNRLDVARSVSTDTAGNVFITGDFDSDTLTVGTTALIHTGGPSSKSMFVVKYDPNGNVRWANKAGYAWINCNVYSQGISTDPVGSAFATGRFDSPSLSFGSFTLTNSGGQFIPDVFLVKYDTAGSVVWAVSVGGTSSESSTGIAVHAGGSVYITGDFNSAALLFGAAALTNAGAADFFIAKIDSVVATGIAEMKTASSVVIAPNPFTSHTTVYFKEEQTNTTISITDVLGKELKRMHFNGNRLHVGRADLPAGIYFVQITDAANKVMTTKIIIE